MAEALIPTGAWQAQEIATGERSRQATASAAAEARPCPTCGAVVPQGFRFCGQCGRALAAALHPSAEGTVTILFTDLEGFTRFSSGMEPDELFTKLNDFFSRAGEHITRFNLGLGFTY